MRRLQAISLGLSLAASGIAACSPGDRNAARDDAADPVPAAAAAVPAQSEQDKAIIAATPQISLTEAQRAEYRSVALNYLNDAAKELAKGFSPVGGVEDSVNAMQPTEVHPWRLTLKRGETYRILAACDNECSDLDLELLDSAGKIIERDTLPDSAPVINIRPTADGVFTARVVMKTCTLAPCYAAARLYHQTGPVPDDDAPPPATA
ncbi:hypothetical protein GCM10017620_24290 [Brevundimonas intermedia]|uniref:Lipoprotein n=1 Tax=Brevundimonas intermedia TaxID=74315 RepID=A0ABQ5TAU5_9CAUL|nr:hypothetical protein [Brevundimonas intermedia]GLK49456.1 hypothetical protein GCM10017620_24290 [Brevundimonas intermedia]